MSPYNSATIDCYAVVFLLQQKACLVAEYFLVHAE